MGCVGDNWSAFIYTDSLIKKYGTGTELGLQRSCLGWESDLGTDRKDIFVIATRGDVGGRSPGRGVWMLPRGSVLELGLER